MLPQNGRKTSALHRVREASSAAAITGFSLLMAASAGQALAMTAPAGSGTTLTVSVSGHISPKCTLDTGQAANTDFGDITDPKTGHAAPATLDLPFAMTCNTPYVATLVSKNGGLVYDGAPVAQFASAVSYSAQLAMGQIAGGVSLSCDSSQMRVQGGDTPTSACRGASSTTIGATAGEGRVKLRLHPSAEPLLRGVYQDELVVNLSPIVSG